MTEQSSLNALLTEAKKNGATDAQVLPASVLVVRPELAQLCGPEKGCPNYGQAPGCPPHAMRPAAFQELTSRSAWALAYKIDAPMRLLAGPERLDIARNIHRIAAAVEQLAKTQGIFRPHAFAAGSCKELFCADFAQCAVLAEHSPCRKPLSARPSLSAVGVDFATLAQTAGWEYGWGEVNAPADTSPMGLMAGLVLLERRQSNMEF